MAEELLIPSEGDLYRDAPAHTVSTRQHWADEWTVQQYLYANWMGCGSGPVLSQAELQWEYGQQKPAGAAALQQYDRKVLLGHYVKIEIPQVGEEPTLTWYGQITDDARRRAGTPIDAGWRSEQGTQILTAEGLELHLERTFVNSAYIDHASGEPKKLGRGLTFNNPNTFQDTGNRSLVLSMGEGFASYTFAKHLNAATWWSTRDIIEYLLAFHPPKDIEGAAIVQWQLSDSAKRVLPGWDRPVVRTQGRSVRSIILELLDRRRLLSWRVIVVQGSPQLDVFSFNGQDLVLPSGNTQTGNQNQTTLDFDLAVDVQALLRDAARQKVEQVIVRGARKRAVVSLSYRDGTLEADWDADDQSDYEAGPVEISELDPDEQQRRVLEFRAEDRFARVFSWFCLPWDWDGQVGDGTGESEKTYFFPAAEAEGFDGIDRRPVAPPSKPLDDERNQETFYLPELRFERYLPKELMQDAAPTDSPQTVPPPIAVIKVEDYRDESVSYQHIERLGDCAGLELIDDGAGRKWSASLRVQPHAPGVIIKVHGGHQHLIAREDFTPLPEIDYDGTLDWQDLAVTVMLQLDSYVEQKYPADQDVARPLDVARVIYRDLGDRARLDWQHPGALLGLLHGVPMYETADGRWLCDDREQMADWARLVYEWYGVDRQAFTLILKQLSGIVDVGELITQIGADDTAEEVNTVVTGITWDLLTGTTRITTAYAELDPVQFL